MTMPIVSEAKANKRAESNRNTQRENETCSFLGNVSFRAELNDKTYEVDWGGFFFAEGGLSGGEEEVVFEEKRRVV